MDHLHAIKAAITAFFVALSAVIGWVGWLVVLFVVCLLVDYLTGTMVALKHGVWSSEDARSGLWHKAGEILALFVAGLADSVIVIILDNVSLIQLPFEYHAMFFPLVLVWYILTELGSTLENVGCLGAPIPAFLRKLILVLKSATEVAGERAAPGLPGSPNDTEAE